MTVSIFQISEPQDSPIGTRNLTSYDAEARRGAAMAALRRDLRTSLRRVAASRPRRTHLSATAEGRAGGDAACAENGRGSRYRAAQIGAAAEISLPISALRKFLECPLQGAAQYALGIFEDEGEDLEQWQDEPIAQSILDRTTLLREVFWKARGNRELLASEYAKAFRISQLSWRRSRRSVCRKPLNELIARTSSNGSSRHKDAGCGSLDRWHEIRMGRGDDFAQGGSHCRRALIPLRSGVGGGMRD